MLRFSTTGQSGERGRLTWRTSRCDMKDLERSYLTVKKRRACPEGTLPAEINDDVTLRPGKVLRHCAPLHALARSLEYPLRALGLCGQMFFAARVIRVGGCFAAAIQPQMGMVPGSEQANHHARALLYELLEEIYASRCRHKKWAASRRQPPSSLYREPSTSTYQSLITHC